MENDDITVVICAAGMGTRLGVGTTKALVDICGKPLIVRQLELLDNYDDVRIVLGYQAEQVIKVVNMYRKDIMFAFNYDYPNTGAAASLSKALPCSRKYVVSIDGDLLINRDDFNTFMAYKGESIAVSTCNSDEPLKTKVVDGKVIKFGGISSYEWPGLVKVKASNLRPYKGYIYELLQNILPMQAIIVDACDIDTQKDYKRAVLWFKKNSLMKRGD